MGKRLVIFAGVTTLLQAAMQVFFSSLAVAQYFCAIDFLLELPILIYIRILYFHSPDHCGIRINIGQAIDSIADQAFVLMNNEPFTVTRTFIINSISLSVSALWLLASCVILAGGVKNTYSRTIRWPWIATTVAISAFDVIATVIFANDAFHTRTLNAIMNYIGGTASGIGGVTLNTTAAAWIMALIYGRLLILFFLNVTLIVLVALNENESDDPVFHNVLIQPLQNNVPEQNIGLKQEQIASSTDSSTENRDDDSLQNIAVFPASDISNIKNYNTVIPRAHFSQAFQSTEQLTCVRNDQPRSPELGYIERLLNNINRVQGSIRSVSKTHLNRRQGRPSLPVGWLVLSAILTRSLWTEEENAKKKVRFPKNLLSLPQRVENLIKEQQHDLDVTLTRSPQCAEALQDSPTLLQVPGQIRKKKEQQHDIDVTFIRSPQCAEPRRDDNISEKTPVTHDKGRQDSELLNQLPWAYIPTSPAGIRNEVPPNEDKPPLPLPDYNAVTPFRKSSVHRVTSTSRLLLQKKNSLHASINDDAGLKLHDVMY